MVSRLPDPRRRAVEELESAVSRSRARSRLALRVLVVSMWTARVMGLLLLALAVLSFNVVERQVGVYLVGAAAANLLMSVGLGYSAREVERQLDAD
ncbi:MAG: hypothetical protein AAFZ65_11780 [Planctomycetota bacterium]